MILDGDNVRHGLCAPPERLAEEHGDLFAKRFGLGFAAEDRRENIRRVDRTGWISPLAVYISLASDERLLLVYPGDLDSANALLRHLRRHARESLIDGIPWVEFWGEAAHPVPEKREDPSPRYQLLRAEDEAEVQRLYQVLKTVGHLDSRQPSDEK